MDDLGNLIRDLSTGISFRHSSAMLTTRITSLLSCDASGLFIRDNDGSSLRLVASHGYQFEGDKKLTIPLDRGVVSSVIDRSEPLNLTDLRTHTEFEDYDGINEEQFPRFLGVPIIDQGQVIGALVAQSRSPNAFSEDHEGILASVATSISAMVAHAIATQEIELESTRASLQEERGFKGYAGSGGIAIGTALLLQPMPELEIVPYREIESEDIDNELSEFDRALDIVRADIAAGKERMQSMVGPEELALFDAYLHMLDDDALPLEVRTTIRNDRLWSQGAVGQVFLKHIREFERSENRYFAERSQDIRDLGQNIIAAMQSQDRSDVKVPPNSILISREISASMITELNTSNLIALVSNEGSMNSHATILARALNIPAVIGVRDLPLLDADGATVIVDGFTGDVILSPLPNSVEHYQALASAEATFQDELETIKDLPCETLDGKRINVWVNIGLVSEISRSLDRGAEGIGLFRTEVPFSIRNRFPTEAEQTRIYREHMRAFDPQPVTMRTLDIGGDKDLPYFPIEEENPFLGWRGIRVTLDHPDIFLQQVRAMFKANAGLEGILRIMLPMVSNIEEIKQAKLLIERAHQEILDEGVDAKEPQIGVLIEVPALILMRQQVTSLVDFVAVGTNDLTQYMLAASRSNPRVAEQYQEFDPAMLRALRMLAKTAHEASKPIGICGELAGTVEGAVLCIGMGYDVLSMNATNIPRVKWVIRHITLTACRRIVARTLRMYNAQEILNYIRDQMHGTGLDKALAHHEPPELFL